MVHERIFESVDYRAWYYDSERQCYSIMVWYQNNKYIAYVLQHAKAISSDSPTRHDTLEQAMTAGFFRRYA